MQASSQLHPIVTGQLACVWQLGVILNGCTAPAKAEGRVIQISYQRSLVESSLSFAKSRTVQRWSHTLLYNYLPLLAPATDCVSTRSAAYLCSAVLARRCCLSTSPTSQQARVCSLLWNHSISSHIQLRVSAAVARSSHYLCEPFLRSTCMATLGHHDFSTSLLVRRQDVETLQR